MSAEAERLPELRYGLSENKETEYRETEYRETEYRRGYEKRTDLRGNR